MLKMAVGLAGSGRVNLRAYTALAPGQRQRSCRKWAIPRFSAGPSIPPDQRVQCISHTRHPSPNTPGESHHSAQITDQEVAVHQRSGTSALRVLEVLAPAVPLCASAKTQ